MRRVLVTGGAGFIGSHLCERLLDQGDEVLCLDNLFTSRLHNIEHLIGRRGFEFVRHDVCEYFHAEVDRIYALACPASPIHYQRNAVRTVKTSVMGTIHALDLARDVGARLLLTSTSEVYGQPLVHPQVESYNGNVNPGGPRACYDESKRCAETLVTSFVRQYGLDARISRLFNCFGPRMAENDGRVVSSFVCQALRGEPLTMFGDGSQTRSFIYVSDMVDALCLLMECDPFVSGTVVNLGNPEEQTVRFLAEQVLHETGSKSAIEYKPLPIDDPVRRRPDISRAKELLGWSPKVPLGDGLRHTVDYFRSVLTL